MENKWKYFMWLSFNELKCLQFVSGLGGNVLSDFKLAHSPILPLGRLLKTSVAFWFFANYVSKRMDCQREARLKHIKLIAAIIIFVPELFSRASLEKLCEKCFLEFRYNNFLFLFFPFPLLLLKLISRFIWVGERLCVCVDHHCGRYLIILIL